jgi:hypothetical protein
MSKVEIVRNVLAENKETTYSQVKGKMEKAGISESYFNVLKHDLKANGKISRKAKAPAPKVQKPSKPALVPVTVEESVTFIRQTEGLERAKATVAVNEKLVTDYLALAGRVEEAGGIEALKETVARQQQMVATVEKLATELKQVA